MNISLNWLKDYLDIELGVEEICDILTSIGLEVGGYKKFESVRGGLQGLVIGKVETCIPHPDSDHLHLTEVDLGDGRLTPIVCGAPNIAAGQKVVVATIGTKLYDGEEEFAIKKSKIRGKESEGMICSEKEIGIGKDTSGILVLPADTKPGTPAAEYFQITNDYVIEVDITPNRVDGASHLGVARDLAAYLKQTRDIRYTLPSVDGFKPEIPQTDISIRIERPEACKRYAGLCIEGVHVKDSPEWLQTRLKAIGLNPINNVVDVTNYVLFELGQPLHAFNKDKIAGKEVVLKSFPDDTKFITLDGIERSLKESDLMVCNAQEPMCIAGVFGGLQSGITADTQNVFLESAYFDSVFVRKTARRLGISTDSSFRFERGTDPNIVRYALKRAALLIQEVAGGKITPIVDVYPQPVKDTEIQVRYSYIDRLIGKAIGKENIKNILSGLEIKIVEESEQGLLIHVPPYRVDVKQEADVVEEILRIYGFNRIESPAQIKSILNISKKPDDYHLKDLISNLLSANGFNEIINNSLTKSSYYENLEAYRQENSVYLSNPLSSDLNVMRQSLLFSGLEVIAYNINRKNGNLRLFEFGKSYIFNRNTEGNPLKQYKEATQLSLFISGNKNISSWNSKEEKSDFFTVKAYGEMVLSRLGIRPDALKTDEDKRDIFSTGLEYSLNGKHILSLGSVNNKVLKGMDIEQEVYYAEISWDNLLKAIKNHKTTFAAIPRFPAVKRDLALLLDKKVTFKEVKEIALRTEKELLKSVSLFDVYEGEKLGADKKSYAVSFMLQDEEKTLTDKQIDKIMNKLMGAYKHLLNAEIR